MGTCCWESKETGEHAGMPTDSELNSSGTFKVDNVKVLKKKEDYNEDWQM